MMGLGLPQLAPAKHTGPSKKADYKMLTSLFLEMDACEARGCWHWDFMLQSKQERLKWLLYARMKREREAHFNDLEIKEMKKKQAEAKTKTSSRRPR